MVETIYHLDTYVCSVCKTEYKNRMFAEFCEASVPETCPLSVGDEIWTYDYGEDGGRSRHKVVELAITSHFMLRATDSHHDAETHPLVPADGHVWIARVAEPVSQFDDPPYNATWFEVFAHVGNLYHSCAILPPHMEQKP